MDKKFFKLSFDSNQYLQNYDWKWQEFKKLPQRSIMNCSCLVFDDSLVIYGGKDISLYDLNKNEWNEKLSKAQCSRTQCGLLYDDISSVLYVGGGSRRIQYNDYGRGRFAHFGDDTSNLSACMEYYNFHKDKWYNDLPETWMSHSIRPILWKDHSILYIASAWNDGAEFLDLRENSKMWTRVYINNIQSLSNVFGADIEIRKANCRLVC